MINLGLKLEIRPAQKFFFYDQAGRARIFKGVDKAKHRALTDAGKLIRVIARNSMKRGKRMSINEIPEEHRWKYIERLPNRKTRVMKERLPRKPSNPDEPPALNVGYLKKFLYYAFDSDTKSVVIGPAALPGIKTRNVPNILEYGGYSEGSYIAARPLMQPAEKVLRSKYVRLWKDAML